MYFPNEVEDNLYLLGIPIPRFLVSIYIYLLDEGSDDFCIQFLDIGDGMNCTFNPRAIFFVKKRTYVYRKRHIWYNLFITQNKP